MNINQMVHGNISSMETRKNVYFTHYRKSIDVKRSLERQAEQV